MTQRPEAHTLYHSRNHELVIDVDVATGEILIRHDLKVAAVPKLRLRAINTLQEKLPEIDEIIATYAPGAKSRKQAELDRKNIAKAIQAIEHLWPEERFATAPTAERADNGG